MLGDPNFSVLQAFPAAISAEDADPFLMCDHFGPVRSDGSRHHVLLPIFFHGKYNIRYVCVYNCMVGVETDPDKFPIGWHPHRGMDILTYMVEGQLEMWTFRTTVLLFTIAKHFVLHTLYTCRSRAPCRFLGEQGDIRIPWNAVDQRGQRN